MADEEKEVIEAVNRLLTAGDPLGAVRQLKRLQKIVKGLPISQEVEFEVEIALPTPSTMYFRVLNHACS